MPNIAELFATLGLDDTDFNAKLRNAKIGMVTAAEDMALPIGRTRDLLKQLTVALGPTARGNLLDQLKEQGYSVRDSVIVAKQAIDELRASERQGAKEAADAASRQKEIWDQQKAQAQESLRVEKQIADQRAAVDKDARARQKELMDQQRGDYAAAARAEAEAAKAVEEANKSQARAAEDAAKRVQEAERAKEQSIQQTISAVNQAGSAMTRVGFITEAAFAPLALGLGLAVKSFADFDEALVTSISIMGQEGKVMKEDLSQAAIELSKNTKFSAKESAEAFYFLASAGLSAKDSIAALPVVADFATAGNLKLERATEVLAQVQSSLGLAIKNDAVANMQEMVHVSDVLVKADTIANAKTIEFAEALINKAGPAARLYGKSIEETVAVLAVFADNGIKAQLAGNYFNIALRDLQQQANKHKNVMLEVNGETVKFADIVYDATGKTRNMADISQSLTSAFKGMSDQQIRSTLTMIGFQDRSVFAIQQLIGMADGIRTYQAELEKAGGITKTVAEQQMETFNKQVLLLKNNITDLAITVGKPLVESLNAFIGKGGAVISVLKELGDAFSSLPPSLQKIIVDGAAAATGLGLVGGAALIAGGQFLQAGAAVSQMIANWDKIAAVLPGVTEKIGVIITALGGSGGLLALVGTGFASAVTGGLIGWHLLNEQMDTLASNYDKVAKKHEDWLRLTGQKPESTSTPDNPNAWSPEAPFTKSSGQQVSAGLPDFKVIIDGTDATKKALVAATQEALTFFGVQKKNLDVEKEMFDRLQAGYDAGLVSAAEYNAGLIKFHNAEKAANAESVAAQKKDTRDLIQLQRDEDVAQRSILEALKFFHVELSRPILDEAREKLDRLKVGLTEVNQVTGKARVSWSDFSDAVQGFNKLITGKFDLERVAIEAETLNDRLNRINWQDIKTGFSEGSTAAELMRVTMSNLTSDLLGADINGLMDYDRALKLLGLDHGEVQRKAVSAFESIAAGAETGKTSLALLEGAWADVSRQVGELAKKDLPAAIKAMEAYIKALHTLAGTQGQQLRAQIDELKIVIQLKAEQGISVTKEMEQLEELKIRYEILIDSATRLGKVYTDIREIQRKMWGEFTQATVDSITGAKSWGEAWMGVVKKLETEILDVLIGTVFKALGDTIESKTHLMQKLADETTKGIGAVLKAVGLAGKVSGSGEAVQGAHLPTEGQVDTSSGEMGSAGPSNSGSPSNTSGASSLISSVSGIANIVGAVAAVGSGIAQGIQMAHLLSDTGKIEVSTRATKEQLIHIQDTLNLYLPELKHLTDIWGELSVGHLHKIEDILWWGVINTHVTNGSKGDSGDNSLQFTHIDDGSWTSFLGQDHSWAQAQQDAANALTSVATQSETTAQAIQDLGTASQENADAVKAASDVIITATSGATTTLTPQDEENFAQTRQALISGTGPLSQDLIDQLGTSHGPAVKQIGNPLLGGAEGGLALTGAPEDVIRQVLQDRYKDSEPGTKDYLLYQLGKGDIDLEGYRTKLADLMIKDQIATLLTSRGTPTAPQGQSFDFGAETFTTPATRGELSVGTSFGDVTSTRTPQQIDTLVSQYASYLQRWQAEQAKAQADILDSLKWENSAMAKFGDSLGNATDALTLYYKDIVDKTKRAREIDDLLTVKNPDGTPVGTHMLGAPAPTTDAYRQSLSQSTYVPPWDPTSFYRQQSPGWLTPLPTPPPTRTIGGASMTSASAVPVTFVVQPDGDAMAKAFMLALRDRGISLN